MMSVIRISAEAGEACEVDIDELHDRVISQLPAEKYLDLFHKMHAKIFGYPAFPAFNAVNCGCPEISDKPE